MLWALLVLSVIGVVAKWMGRELPKAMRDDWDKPLGPDEDQW